MLGPQRLLTGVRRSAHTSLLRVTRTSANPRTQVLSLQAYLPNSLRFASNSSSLTMNPTDTAEIQKVHDFWYGRSPKEWFMPPDGFDEHCKEKFGHLVRDARSGKLDHWTSEPDGTLALLILLDQFSRNVFRDTPDAFSADPKALEIATRAIAKGWDQKATTPQALTYVCPTPWIEVTRASY
jgi:hypothetical protein